MLIGLLAGDLVLSNEAGDLCVVQVDFTDALVCEDHTRIVMCVAIRESCTYNEIPS